MQIEINPGGFAVKDQVINRIREDGSTEPINGKVVTFIDMTGIILNVVMAEEDAEVLRQGLSGIKIAKPGDLPPTPMFEKQR